MKKRLKPVIVVEGQSDVNKLSLLVDADFVITNGSEVSRETIEYLTKLSFFRQIIVLTDPDYPGTRIRNIINQAIPNCFNAFVSKEKSIKKNKVGVAECDSQEILRSLEDMIQYREIDKNNLEINMVDLYSLGLLGQFDSARKRNYLSDYYHIGKVNAKTLIKRLNMLELSIEDIKKVIEKYENSQ